MCEIACQVRHPIVWSILVAISLMVVEFGFRHGGSLGSCAERVISQLHSISANAKIYIRYQPTANGKSSTITPERSGSTIVSAGPR